MTSSVNVEDEGKVRKMDEDEEEISGFVCPHCPHFVRLESEQLLFDHWKICHDKDGEEADGRTGGKSTWRAHSFNDKCRKGLTCKYCAKRIWRDGSKCSLCRYPCHDKCAVKAMTESSCPGFHQSTNPIVKNIRKVVTGNKIRYVTEYVDLDMTYITPRIIAMSFPASGLMATYRNSLNDVASLLNSKYGSHYLVFNVSDKSYDISKLDHQVLDFGWPDHMAPPLERLCSIILSLSSWLESDEKNVVVVHCKGGKGRTGVVVASYFSFRKLFNNAEDAMYHFALKRFANAEVGGAHVGVSNPSQRRYVRYIDSIVNGNLQVWPKPIRLLHVVMQTIPRFSRSHGCRPVLVIYEDVNKEIYRSPDPEQVVEKTERFFKINVGIEGKGLVVKGDITIRLFHRSRHGNDNLILFTQIHTATIDSNVLTLEKKDLDEACRDKRVADNANLTLVFGDLDKKITRRSMAESSESIALYQNAVRNTVNDHLLDIGIGQGRAFNGLAEGSEMGIGHDGDDDEEEAYDEYDKEQEDDVAADAAKLVVADHLNHRTFRKTLISQAKKLESIMKGEEKCKVDLDEDGEEMGEGEIVDDTQSSGEYIQIFNENDVHEESGDEDNGSIDALANELVMMDEGNDVYGADSSEEVETATEEEEWLQRLKLEDSEDSEMGKDEETSTCVELKHPAFERLPHVAQTCSASKQGDSINADCDTSSEADDVELDSSNPFSGIVPQSPSSNSQKVILRDVAARGRDRNRNQPQTHSSSYLQVDFGKEWRERLVESTTSEDERRSSTSPSLSSHPHPKSLSPSSVKLRKLACKGKRTRSSASMIVNDKSNPFSSSYDHAHQQASRTTVNGKVGGDGQNKGRHGVLKQKLESGLRSKDGLAAESRQRPKSANAGSLLMRERTDKLTKGNHNIPLSSLNPSSFTSTATTTTTSSTSSSSSSVPTSLSASSSQHLKISSPTIKADNHDQHHEDDSGTCPPHSSLVKVCSAQLLSLPYYMGELPQDKCNRLLMEKASSGEFIVILLPRQKQGDAVRRSCAVHLMLCLRVRKGIILHFNLQFVGESMGHFKLYLFPTNSDGCTTKLGVSSDSKKWSEAFPSLQELVSFYQHNPIFQTSKGNKVRLGSGFGVLGLMSSSLQSSSPVRKVHSVRRTHNNNNKV
eukprot:m.148788 g.148788  ORF g.148788 m.148788 type:complete len:1155 (-) comp13264_c2_seq1:283-3747(-)